MSSPGAAALRRNGLGWYLYGVIAASEAPVHLGARGAVDPVHEVELVTEGPLAGVASRVSLQEFDEETLPDRLGDASWLEQKIRAHEQVLEGLLDEVSVVPCRFCTVYTSEAELRRFLSERGEALGAALDRVQGQVEVGVKAFIDRDRFAAGGAVRNDAIRELESRASAAEGGRAYLERRRLDQLIRSELERFTDEAAAEIHSRLLAVTDDGLLLPLQTREVSGRDHEMFFNGAYLVNADQSAFKETLAVLAGDYRETGVDLEATGPWPPYNFVPAELGAS